MVNWLLKQWKIIIILKIIIVIAVKWLYREKLNWILDFENMYVIYIFFLCTNENKFIKLEYIIIATNSTIII